MTNKADGSLRLADELKQESREEKTKSVGETTVKLDVDVSEALTGLKAVQREARKATQALRELEDASKGVSEWVVARAITDDIRRSYE